MMQIGLSSFRQSDSMSLTMSPFGKVYVALGTISAILSGYHGYKRNNSIGWGIGWFALGGLFPVITPTIAFAQGYGKRA